MSDNPTSSSPGFDSGSVPPPTPTVGEVKDKVAETARLVRDAALGKAESLKAAAAGKAEELKDAAQRKAEEVRSSAEARWESSCDRAKEFQHVTEDYIRANPLAMILGALGLGFIIGLATRR